MYQFGSHYLGDLEKLVLETLWAKGPLAPATVHQSIAGQISSSVKTVSSALKRLYEKGFLDREKVSHAYVYKAKLSKLALQKAFLDQIVTEMGGDQESFLTAFVDLAHHYGHDTLKNLEKMIQEKLEDEAP